MQNIQGTLFSNNEESTKLKNFLLRNLVAVNYGGGTNSTALILALYERHIPIDLIVFADTGAEHQHTYRFLDKLDDWLRKHNMPIVTRTRNIGKKYPNDTLEKSCLRAQHLPSIAYGHKSCSMKWKGGPNDKLVRWWYKNLPNLERKNKTVCRLLGYEKGEDHRHLRMTATHKNDKNGWVWLSPLIVWDIGRQGCIDLIRKHGLPQPGKSSCIFCPSMKRQEIIALAQNYPGDFERAIRLERNALPNCTNVKGLGRNFSWENFIFQWRAGNASQFEETELPVICDCYI